MFKAIITTNPDAQVGRNQEKIVVNLPFYLEIEIDKNNSLSDIHPRVFKGVDLLSKYRGRPRGIAVMEAAQELMYLNSEE